MSGQDLSAIRREYNAEALRSKDLAADPVEQFEHWFQQAHEVVPDDATSMVLATADAKGMPAARILLLKHFDHQGFCWYTDYDSDKGRQLDENPQAALLFYWRALERQVRISGRVERLDRSSAEQYFASRPYASRLSAAANVQRQVVADRETLETSVENLAARYDEASLQCPEHWGGYRLVPERFEFWQGRENRLHDRFVYTGGPHWCIERLTP